MMFITTYIFNKFADKDVSFSLPQWKTYGDKKTVYVPFFIDFKEKLEYAFVVQKELLETDIELKIIKQPKEGVVEYYTLEPVRQEDVVLKVGRAGEQFLTMI